MAKHSSGLTPWSNACRGSCTTVQQWVGGGVSPTIQLPIVTAHHGRDQATRAVIGPRRGAVCPEAHWKLCAEQASGSALLPIGLAPQSVSADSREIPFRVGMHLRRLRTASFSSL